MSPRPLAPFRLSFEGINSDVTGGFEERARLRAELNGYWTRAMRPHMAPNSISVGIHSRRFESDFRSSRAAPCDVRPYARGKFIWLGDEKLYIRGVTYGTFRPNEDGNEYYKLELIERDFARMAASAINAVRVYNTPPHSVLDLAQRHGLRVIVDLAADQYVGFLTDRKGALDIHGLVRDKVRGLSRHPAILAYSLGNEIPAALVRWHGRRRIERYLKGLYRVVKTEDPAAMVTYVNYPSTEYLELPFLDFFCFNVYLESQERFASYLARLQNIVGDLPLVMSEIGLDSYRNGTKTQARVLDWQIRTAFEAGCAGVFVYSWTDEWYRGGAEAEDWAFGITTRERSPKAALAAVRHAFTDTPFSQDTDWPSVSVVVCTYNGSRTLRECCVGLCGLDYPNFEVIVVDDGSTDDVTAIAREYGFRVIRTPNRGLSSARNTGLESATGEIVAYIDDDAYPDPQWLSYLAQGFLTSDAAAIGGPNIPPPGDGALAECVANAPGGPVHVLISDREAEHIPGCNMAFRKAALNAIGGFDPRFRVAGDDVDVCWRLRQSGRTIRFCPAAVVWHHRRGSLRTYWTQQRGYGKAEALLEAKWPEKYNAVGHVSWAGRVYGNGHSHWLWGRERIYQGTWGTAPFQSVYQPSRGLLSSLPLMPEWYLLIPLLGALSALGVLWAPLSLTGPLFVASAAVPVFQCWLNAAHITFRDARRSGSALIAMRSLVALLHLLQPLARLYGRLSHGLSPWRRRHPIVVSLPWPETFALWFEHWQAPSNRLQAIEWALRAAGRCVFRGGDFNRWDLEVRGGILGAARLRMAVEEHGLGRQLVRFRIWPRPAMAGLVLAALFLVLAIAASSDGARAAALIFVLVSLSVAVSEAADCVAPISELRGLILKQQAELAIDRAQRAERITLPRPMRHVARSNVAFQAVAEPRVPASTQIDGM
jgi:GT2 family glycosyltransferase